MSFRCATRNRTDTTMTRSTDHRLREQILPSKNVVGSKDPFTYTRNLFPFILVMILRKDSPIFKLNACID